MTDPTRVTSCYLYQESPSLPYEALSDVLAANDAEARARNAKVLGAAD